MMQRWRIAVLVATTLVGCQLDRSPPAPETAQVSENLGEACGTKLPDAVIFDGKQRVPRATPGQVWVFVPSTKEGETTAALVDTVKLTIPYVAIVTRGALGRFVDDIGNAAEGAFTGHPNPPPPVIDPDLLMAMGLRTPEAINQAEADAKACQQKSQ